MNLWTAISYILLLMSGVVLGLLLRDLWPNLLRHYYCENHGWVYHTHEAVHKAEHKEND